MRGLILRVTNNTAAPLTITDVTGLATFAAGETRDILYLDDVQNSLEYGRLNSLIIAGSVTVLFVSGTNLNQAPIGRTFTGATPVVTGDRGLVPTATVAQRSYYLKGDGTWGAITALSVGALPQSLLTTQGDLIVRGPVTAERLPLGSLGYVLRSGPVTAQWAGMCASGTFAARPVATAFYAGSYYWATDTSTLYLCYWDGAAWAWSVVNVMGGWDTFPTGGTPTFAADITHVGRASVGVSPASSIPAGIQFEVLGDSLFDRMFLVQKVVAADQTGATQVRADTTDKGLYSKGAGYSERRFDLPGLVRKTIPTPEVVNIPAGSEYLVYGGLSLEGTATLNLLGDAELDIVSDPPILPTILSVMTGNGDLLYRNGTGNLARLPVGNAGDVLTVTAGMPSWQDTPPGAVKTILRPFVFGDQAAPVDSVTRFPAGAYIVRVSVCVTVAFNGAGAVAVVTSHGPGGDDTLAAAVDSNLAVPGQYEVWEILPLVPTHEGTLRVTIGGALGATGAGFVLVKYTIPET